MAAFFLALFSLALSCLSAIPVQKTDARNDRPIIGELLGVRGKNNVSLKCDNFKSVRELSSPRT